MSDSEQRAQQMLDEYRKRKELGKNYELVEGAKSWLNRLVETLGGDILDEISFLEQYLEKRVKEDDPFPDYRVQVVPFEDQTVKMDFLGQAVLGKYPEAAMNIRVMLYAGRIVVEIWRVPPGGNPRPITPLSGVMS